MKTKQYYVYTHVDPETKEILYVGKGVRHRAWLYQDGDWDNNSGYRRPKHRRHLTRLSKRGFLPGDWVKILRRGLSNQKALELERLYIKRLKPKYNIPSGANFLKLSYAKIKKGKLLLDLGKSQTEVAKILDVTDTIVYNAIVNPSPRYKDLIERHGQEK